VQGNGSRLPTKPGAAIIARTAWGEQQYVSYRELRHNTARFRHSRRLRYRIARLLVIWLPFLVFLYALALAR